MKLNNLAFLARTVSGGGGGGGGSLTIVQQPDGVEDYTNAPSIILSAIGNGNGVVVAVRGLTSFGAPTISDNQGGSWGAAVFSAPETANNTTTWYFIRNNITSGLTTITATFSGTDECRIGVVELSGGTIVMDGSGIDSDQAAADPWTINFTTTQNNTVLIGMAVFSNNTTIADTAPINADAATSYFGYFRGQFATAGSNSATLDLNDPRSGAYSAIVVKAS